MKTAVLAFYRKSFLDRLLFWNSHPAYDKVLLSDVKNNGRGFQNRYWRVGGVINFEDNRPVRDIAEDFSRKLGGEYECLAEPFAILKIPRSQRPIITQAFVEYFTRRSYLYPFFFNNPLFFESRTKCRVWDIIPKLEK